MRDEGEPLVVEFVTRRLGPHSKGDDTRPAHQTEEAARADWYPRYRAAFPGVSPPPTRSSGPGSAG
ncbi:hypothetical protein NKH77_44530 [Streptomyces sp. M19]